MVVDQRIFLKGMNGRVGTGFIWLRIVSSDGLL
jgi:hypothetical protein